MIITVKIYSSKFVKDIRLEEVNSEEFNIDELFDERGNLSISF